MNDHERTDEAWIADFLGDELSADERRAFALRLERDAALRAEVQSLERAQASLRSLRAPDESATPHQRPHQRPPRPHALGVIARYAAVVLVAFGAGFLSAGGRSTQDAGAPSAAPSHTARAADRYLAADTDSGFARSLMVLSEVIAADAPAR